MIRRGRLRFSRIKAGNFALALAVLALAVALAAPLHVHAERTANSAPCVFCALATTPALAGSSVPVPAIQPTLEPVVAFTVTAHAPTLPPTPSGRAPPLRSS